MAFALPNRRQSHKWESRVGRGINIAAGTASKGYNRVGELIVIAITASRFRSRGRFNVMRSQITERFILATETRNGLSMAR